MSELHEIGGTSETAAAVASVSAAPTEDPAAWRVADFSSPMDYTIELTPTHLGDIQDAMWEIKAAGLGLDDLTREHFPFPSLQG